MCKKKIPEQYKERNVETETPTTPTRWRITVFIHDHDGSLSYERGRRRRTGGRSGCACYFGAFFCDSNRRRSGLVENGNDR